VVVALSGGVDSAVAATLLVKRGYKCIGLHMKLWTTSNRRLGNTEALKSAETLRRAQRVAKKLEIPFYVVDLRKEFKKRVVDYFCEAYGKGLTPNPCVVCNRFIKFGKLLDYARRLECEYLATGHYARIAVEVRGSLFSKTQAGKKGELKNYSSLLSDPPTRVSEVKSNCNWTADQYFSKRIPSPLFHLLVARDKKKDQSYFLYRLNQGQLSHVMFPNGEYLKSEVREMARKWGLPVKDTRESQEICFLEGQDYREFLQSRIAWQIKPGEVIDSKGKVVGEHFGLPLYTIGQRSGFRIEHRAFGREKRKVPVLYVVEKDGKKNRLVVGREYEMQKKEFEVGELGLINPGVELAKFKKDVKVKLRSQGKLLNCRVFRLLKGKTRICLEKPEMGLAAGQSAVFYRGYEVLGGGVII